MAPIVLNGLREWKLICPKGELDLVFPTGAGGVESHSNIMQRGFQPLQVAAGIVDETGAAKYGLHALRHACASLWIEQGMNPKRIQKLMGHSSIQMTFAVQLTMFQHGVVRLVTVPDYELNGVLSHDLEKIFYYGQNIVQPNDKRVSVSMGDIIWKDGRRFLIMAEGFEEMGPKDKLPGTFPSLLRKVLTIKPSYNEKNQTQETTHSS